MRKLNELHLFAGAGGGILGGELLGHRTVCAVEIEEHPRKALLQRQRDGLLPWFPIWDDITTFDGTPWKEYVDIVAGGFPCQDISIAGGGRGLSGERSGLWKEQKRIVSEIGPSIVFVENSPALTFRGGVRVIADLASMGYVCRWGVMGNGAVGAVCEGERIWIIAVKTNGAVLESVDLQKFKVTHSEESLRREYSRAISAMLSQDDYSRIKLDSNEVADQMGQLKAVGNGQNPFLAALAFTILSEGLI